MSSKILLGGSVSMQNPNTPTREGQRVPTESDIAKINSPFIGLIIYVEDQDQFYYVASLKSKKVGNFEIKNALVDEYKVFSGNTESLIWNNVQ